MGPICALSVHNRIYDCSDIISLAVILDLKAPATSWSGESAGIHGSSILIRQRFQWRHSLHCSHNRGKLHSYILLLQQHYCIAE